jgi:hypothetical protein
MANAPQGLGGLGGLRDGGRNEHDYLGRVRRDRGFHHRLAKFNDPIPWALDRRTPVLAYNANGDARWTNPALAYISQDLFEVGV